MSKPLKRKSALPQDIHAMQDTVSDLRRSLAKHQGDLAACTAELFAEVVLLRQQREEIATAGAEIALRAAQLESELQNGRMDIQPLAASRQNYHRTLVTCSSEMKKFYEGRGPDMQPENLGLDDDATPDIDLSQQQEGGADEHHALN